MTDLPAYESDLSATHEVFDAEFRRCVASLPVSTGAQILDLACGDGYFARLFAEQNPQASRVYGIDRMLPYVQTAQQTTEGFRNAEISTGNVYSLDFASEMLDLVWCAQSLVSVGDADRAFLEIMRVLKRGGTLAVLEQDQLHELLLPWPPDLEVAIQGAMLQQSAKAGRDACVGRSLRARLENAGFVDVRRASFAADREAPLGKEASRFLDLQLRRQAALATPYLSERDRVRMHRLCESDFAESLLREPDLEFTYLFWLWTCKKP